MSNSEDEISFSGEPPPKKTTRFPASRRLFSLPRRATDVRPRWRREVRAWMRSVCEDRGSPPETFALAASYVERFVGVCPLGRSQLQVLGAACILVAGKLNEPQPPSVVELSEYADFNLTPTDIVEWESLLLAKLEWDLSASTTYDFLELIVRQVSVSADAAFLMGSMAPDELLRRSESYVSVWSDVDVPPIFAASSCVLAALEDHVVDAASAARAATLLEELTALSRESLMEHATRIEKLINRPISDVAASPPLDQTFSPSSEEKQFVEENLATSSTVGYSDKFYERDDQPSLKRSGGDPLTPTKVFDVALRHC